MRSSGGQDNALPMPPGLHAHDLCRIFDDECVDLCQFGAATLGIFLDAVGVFKGLLAEAR